MKCLFVYKTASLDITDPMGIMCLIASVKQHGHEADLFLTNLEPNLFRAVAEYKPDVIGFSLTSGSEPYYLELIRRLAPNYRLGLISNTNPWHFESTIRPCEVFPLFQAVTLSHEMKAMKPDPRLYLDCIRRLDLPAGACVFIDDRPEFVEGAARIGMGGITYTGSESLRAALEALGVRA